MKNQSLKKLRSEGESAKQHGMLLAVEHRAELVAAGRVALLAVMLISERGEATVDDATADLSAKYADGGKWRGSIPGRLVKLHIIELAGYRKSDRPSRHRSPNTVWRLLDRGRAQAELYRLSALIDMYCLSKNSNHFSKGLKS